MSDVSPPPPSVLVVVPTLGERIETLKDALRSIAEQEGVETQIVMVVPTDAFAARDLAAEYAATIVDDPRQGLSAAANAGLRRRTHEDYCAWLGDDDLIAPGGLSALARLFAEDADAVVAYGACSYIDPEGRQIALSAAGDLAARILSWGPDLVPHPASLIRFSALDVVGLYDESLKFAMDLDIFLRLKAVGRFRSTKQVTASFRWHPQSLTVANRAMSSAEPESVKRRHLSPRVRPFAPLWDGPVRVASRYAAKRLNARAIAIAEQAGT